MRSRWKSIFTVTLIFSLFSASSAFSSEPYCLAIRGNGEAQPAHWGALASLVENKGLPSQQSGGSSGAISMFLLENIAANTWVTEAGPKEEASRASFLIKTIHGIANHFATSKEAQEALDLKQFIGKHQAEFKKMDLTALQAIIMAQNPKELDDRKTQIESVVKTLQSLGVGETPAYKELFVKLLGLSQGISIKPQDLPKIQFYTQDLKQAIATFGAFSAKSDPYLFFREGLLSFPKFALATGRVATFLSGKYWDTATKTEFSELETDCLPEHQGKSWQTIISKKPLCQKLIGDTIDKYFEQKLDWDSKSINVVYQNIGDTIPSYPSTSVLIKSAYTEALEAMSQYHNKMIRTGAEAFEVSNSNHVKFGYWGDTDRLESIGKKLPTNDAKSARFLNLGSASWYVALSASPAEPGLAPLQKIKVQKEAAYSAGGWADLHPVPVLKAADCDSVIYVTRKGGESLFAQGVAKRLLNFKRHWDKLWTDDKDKKSAIKLINQEGDPSDSRSLWSQLYNVANENSSYMKSVQQADAIVCTDWDNESARDDLPGIVEDGYKAPWVVQNSDLLAELQGSPLSLLKVEELKSDQVGCGYQP